VSRAARAAHRTDMRDELHDFRILDTWQLPVTLGARGSFRELVALFVDNGVATDSRAANALFALRKGIGKALHLDGAASGPREVYRRDDDALFAITNKTVDARIRLRPRDDGGVTMDVLVRPVNRLTGAYLAAIRPFRHRIVYPALFARLERRWNERPARA
jgi:hypothetical protein